jgi:hypothetical protein
MSYTKGKWEFDADEQLVECNGVPVCTLHPRGVHEDIDNGNLMAASPELLDACVYAKERLENMTTEEFRKGDDANIRTKLNLAIMKAEGK